MLLSATKRIIKCHLSRMSIRCLSSSSNLSQSLYMWGTNKDGNLMNLPEKVERPTLVDWRSVLDVPDESVSIREVVCGPHNTAIVLSDGRCFVSGPNNQGQLGLGHKNAVTTPTLLEGISVKSISLGPNSSALVDGEGELYTFGFGGSTLSGVGQLGHGDAEASLEPKLVHSMIEDGCHAKQVSCGEYHTTALTTEGEILCTGAGSYGRLGNFETHDQLFFEPVELLTSGVDQISCGKSFTLALRDGVVYGWGRNHKGQLGTGYGMAVDMYAMSEVPSEIVSDNLNSKTVKKIAAGHSLAACITNQGELYFWGMSLHLEPEYVAALAHAKIVDIAIGDDFWLALDDDGILYTYDKNSKVQKLDALEKKKIFGISSGWKHFAAIVEE
mmetsp:Transcript_4965/g.5760  ORF Transcript_4965/g.5760 Transcript_4965/m.5760 type:complete len:386 (-) Transcript_4965:45-1202(-)